MNNTIKSIMLEGKNKLIQALLSAKRPGTLKVNEMEKMIMNSTPKKEKEYLQLRATYAFVYSQLQETTEFFNNYLEDMYGYIKKGGIAKGKPLTAIEYLDYTKKEPWEKVEKYPIEIQNIYKKAIEPIQEYTNSIIESYNRYDKSILKNYNLKKLLLDFKECIVKLKETALSYRNKKVLMKKEFEKCLNKTRKNMGL